MQTTSTPKIVVIGGGFAGIQTVKALLKYHPKAAITLVSKSLIFEYYPALYKLVTGALPIEVSVPIKTIFPKDVELLEATYTGIDQARQVVLLEGGKELPYDYAVIALGSETNYFGIPGLPERSYSFKSVSEALRLKQHFCKLFGSAATLPKDEQVAKLRTIIVGAGPSGVELAGDLRHYLTRLALDAKIDPNLIAIDLIDGGSRVLPVMSERISNIAESRLRKMGINIYVNRALQAEEIDKIILKDMEVKTGTVIWTAGTRINGGFNTIPNVALTERKRVQVTDYLTLPNDNRVFVAGDGAGTQYSGLAQTAIYDGNYIGKHIANLIKGKKIAAYKPTQPSFVIPIGTGWALFSSGNFVMTGLIPWFMRSAIDFKYFVSIVPLSYVFKVFQLGKKYRKVKGGCSIDNLAKTI